MKQARKKIIIAGGGFAGISAAKELALYSHDYDISLIDRNAHTTMVPGLPDLAAAKFDEIALKGDLRSAIPASIDFIQADIKKISMSGKTIFAEQGEHDYDYLLLACGSSTNFFGFSENRQKIHTVDSLEGAARLRDSFLEYIKNTKNPTVVISGAGYTGLETATSLKYRAEKEKKDINIKVIELAEDILPFLTKKEITYIRKLLDRHSIEILTGSKVSRFDSAAVTLDNGEVFKNAFFIWTAGTMTSIADIEGEAKKIGDGRLIVNSYLNIPDYPEVFAAGDSAAISHENTYLRKSVNFAIQSGSAAARNLLKKANGMEMKPYIPKDLGWVIPLTWTSVGRLFGKTKIKGKKGLMLHYFMCGYRNYNLKNFLFFLKKSINPLI